MQFAPKTEAQIAEENLWPIEPEYDFTVTEAEERVSKKGNPMIALKLTVYNAEGKMRQINDYLMESMAYKLRHFCYAVGLGAAYDAGNLDPAAMVGKSGRCELKVEKQEGYNPKNSIKDYIVPAANAAASSAAKARPAPATVASESEPPF